MENGFLEGYHLFFEPTGALAHELVETIEVLAKEYQSTAFPPHVTLLAGIPNDSLEAVFQKAHQVASRLTPFVITLEGFGIEGTYFRALYHQATPSLTLSEAHQIARDTFELEESASYMPHLSLLYGLYPKEKKEETIQELSLPVQSSFTADSISLYKTQGAISDWVKIKEYSLGR